MGASNEIVVEARRGDCVESVHRVAWCLAEPDGQLGGQPHVRSLTRSAVKPLQALVAVRADVLARFGLDDRHIAIGCASHGGSDEHVARVIEVLAACGLGEAELACGADEPRDPSAAAALRKRGAGPARVRHNCSGKHALGLAVCVAAGWPARDYLEPSHPLQAAMRGAIEEGLGAGPGALAAATDGCGMVTYYASLAQIARGFGALAREDAPFGGGEVVVAAMRAHPGLVAFAGAIDTELMAGQDGVIAKIGAEGLLAVGLADGRGLALKVLDGAPRAVAPAAVEATRSVLGLPAATAALTACAAPPIANSRGEMVGELAVRQGAST